MLKEMISVFRTKSKKAVIEGELFKVLMAVLLLAVLLIGVGLITGKGAAILSSIKNFLKFGR